LTDEPAADLNAGAQSAAHHAGSLLVVCLLILPFFALLPATHPLALSTWMLTLIGKILCYAIVAVALDLVWGYAGMLSLGTASSSPWAAMRWACT
jgi:urea transport system permease protein